MMAREQKKSASAEKEAQDSAPGHRAARVSWFSSDILISGRDAASIFQFLQAESAPGINQSAAAAAAAEIFLLFIQSDAQLMPKLYTHTPRARTERKSNLRKTHESNYFCKEHTRSALTFPHLDAPTKHWRRHHVVFQQQRPNCWYMCTSFLRRLPRARRRTIYNGEANYQQGDQES